VKISLLRLTHKEDEHCLLKAGANAYEPVNSQSRLNNDNRKNDADNDKKQHIALLPQWSSGMNKRQ